MADNLPTGTIRTNCQVLSVELDPVTKFPHLMLSNGSVLRAKVYFCVFYINIFFVSKLKAIESLCSKLRFVFIYTDIYQVVIGCDGVNSAIASMFGLHRTTLRLFSTSVARGFTNYPNGHKFSSEFVMMSKGQVQLGRLPVTDKLVYWFVTRLRTSKGHQILLSYT